MMLLRLIVVAAIVALLAGARLDLVLLAVVPALLMLSITYRHTSPSATRADTSAPNRSFGHRHEHDNS